MSKYFSKMIAIGDSHVGNFSEICKTLAFGPETMFGIGNGSIENHIITFKNSGDLQNNHLWIYCFGEIDVRCHIYKQINTYKRNIEEIITTLVDKYISFIIKTNNQIAVCGCVPPAKIEGKEYKLQDTINSKYNFRGSDEDRKNYTIKLNDYLQGTCKKNNIIYIDMYNNYNINGFLNEELAADLIHISNKKYINNYVCNLSNIGYYL